MDFRIDRRAADGAPCGLRSTGLSPIGCVSLPDALPSYWHIVTCSGQTETFWAKGIRQIDGFQALVPMVRVLVPQPNRPALRRAIPAFPGYILALWQEGAPWQRICALADDVDVLRCVGERDRPAVVDPGFMFRLLLALGPDGVLGDERSAPEAEAPFAPGHHVRVDGRFDGICDWATPRRVSVLLGALRMTVPRSRVEAVLGPSKRRTKYGAQRRG